MFWMQKVKLCDKTRQKKGRQAVCVSKDPGRGMEPEHQELRGGAVRGPFMDEAVARLGGI